MKLWLCTGEHLYLGTHYKNRELMVTEDWEYPESYNAGYHGSWRELYASDFPGLVGYHTPAPPPDMDNVWMEIQILKDRVQKLEGGTSEISEQKIREAAWFK